MKAKSSTLPILLFVAIACLGLCGCVGGFFLPVQTKAEARSRPTLCEPEILHGDLVQLVRYWEDHASRPTRGILEPRSGSRVDLYEKAGVAELVSGEGMIDGLIELRRISENKVTMTCHAWGSPAAVSIIKGWRETLLDGQSFP